MGRGGGRKQGNVRGFAIKKRKVGGTGWGHSGVERNVKGMLWRKEEEKTGGEGRERKPPLLVIPTGTRVKVAKKKIQSGPGRRGFKEKKQEKEKNARWDQ